MIRLEVQFFDIFIHECLTIFKATTCGIWNHETCLINFIILVISLGYFLFIPYEGPAKVDDTADETEHRGDHRVGMLGALSGFTLITSAGSDHFLLTSRRRFSAVKETIQRKDGLFEPFPADLVVPFIILPTKSIEGQGVDLKENAVR